MAEDKLKKLARLQALEEEPAVTTEMELERVDFLLDEHTSKIDEVGKGCEQIVSAINTLDQNKADKEDVRNQIENVARMPGRPGNPGTPGKDGKDYVLTDDDKAEIAMGIEVPVVEKVIERTEVIKEQPIIKTEVIKEITLKEDLAGEAIISKINALPLEDDKKIGAEHIRNLPQAMSKHYPAGVSEALVKKLIADIPTPSSTFTALTDTFSSYTGLGGQGLRVNGTETGIDTYTPTDTDEKVKLNASDPTAGYLEDKGDPRYLKLDQTTPQSVINGRPSFTGGLRVGSGADKFGATFEIDDASGMPFAISMNVNYDLMARWWHTWAVDNLGTNSWMDYRCNQTTGDIELWSGDGTNAFNINAGSVTIYSSQGYPATLSVLGGITTTVIRDNNSGVKVADFTSPYRIFYDASEVAKITLGSSGGPIILNEFVGGAGGFLKSSTSGEIQLDSTTYLASGGWYDTAQSSVYLSGFNNDLGNYGGWLTYWDTISGADYANTANYAYSSGYADSSGYASSCDYANYWGGYSFPYYSGSPASQYIGWDSTGAFGAFAISSLFDSWVAGTPVAPSGVAEFNDGASNYFRVWNLANSSLSQWSDGTNTMTIGGTSGLDYVAGASDVDVRLNGTYVHLIDAGTSLPFSYQNTKDSTDTVIELGRLSRKTTGTAGDGIGGALPIYLTNDNGDQEIFAQTDVVGTDVSDGAEVGKYVFKTMVAGTLTPIAEINDTIELKETVWEDLNFDPTRSGGPVATRPDSVTINNVFHTEFTSANNQLCGSVGEIPHKYKLGTDLSPHAHIFLKSGESSGTTGVTFTVYWELRQSTGITSGSTTLSATSAELASTAGGNKLDIFDSAFTGSAELGGQLALTIARTGGNAGDIIVTTYGVHYEIDTIGSRTISSK